jgi:hypothetical protein
MISETAPSARCSNEGCVRPAEPGEDYCSVCCLEWNLFRRDERRPQPEPSAVRAREAGQR